MTLLYVLMTMSLASAGTGNKTSGGALVSFDSALSLTSASAYLTWDLLQYANDKFTEALPSDYRVSYKKFRVDLKNYWSQHVDPVIKQSKDAVWVVVAPALEFLGTVYARADELSGSVLNPVIAEFEKKFPVHAGAFGVTLADRLTFGVWIFFLFKVAKRLVFGKAKKHLHKRG
jgi:hypothetical protein